MNKRTEGYIYLACFIACIPLANWLIGHVGTVCPPDNPCLVPVGFGLMAPSGVLMIGLALVLRDLVQRRLGVAWSVNAIIVGAVISAFVAPPEIAIASAFAFLFSEFADFLVYTPLQQRRFVIAVIVSSVAGLIVDSVIFLYLAFGSLDFLLGQVIGKAIMVAISIPFVYWLRRRDARSASAN